MYTTHPAPPPPGVSRFLSLTSNQQSSTPHSTTSHASSSSTYTPIKVRGKKRKLPITTHTPKILQQHQPKKIKRSLALVMEAHATNPRLTLDTLPAEILENILLYSTNLSLPKAHPLIGLKLSQKATLIRLFIWAFHETWDGWFGFPTAKTLLGPHINVHGKEQTTVDGDHDLQTALLRQPWATTDFILQAQQTWAESYGRGRWYQHSLPWNEEPIDLKHSHHGGHCHFDSRKCFEVDYQQALKWAPFQSSSYPWGYQDVHPKAQAPTDLLTGPWNDEQLRRLFWLTRGGLMGFNARGDNAPSWEIKLQFLRNAILDVSEVNVLAVNCLMCNNVYQDIPRDILMKEKENISTRLQWGDDTDNGRQILEQVRDSMDMVLQYSR